jgi:uncharacterized protein (DUF924 family)
MTAISPYAPLRRNSFLRSSSSSIQPRSSNGHGAAALTFFLLVIKFWGEANKRQRLLELFRKRPTFLGAVNWVKATILGKNSGTIEDVDYSAPARQIAIQTCDDASALDDDDDDNDHNPSSSFQRAKHSQALIRSVLKYWFGSGTPDQNQKNLWMIAADSKQLRVKVDREITEKFEGLLMDLSTDEHKLYKEWCLDGDGMYGSHGKIAIIIVLDQFSRHMRRHYETTNNKSPSNLPSKQALDALAYKTARFFIENHQEEIQGGMIPLPMYIFSLMPYRHASRIDTLENTQKCVEGCAALNGQMEAMLGRFRKATNRRLAVLQDEARRTGKKQQSSETTAERNGCSDEEILETFQFDADMSPSVNYQVHKTIASFFNDRGIHPTKNAPPVAVIVSLSGGVDSMVIAAVLSHMVKICEYNLKVIASKLSELGDAP